MSIVCRPQIVIPMMPGPPAQCRPDTRLRERAGFQAADADGTQWVPPTSRARRFPVERADGRCCDVSGHR